jgi:hypothetical protein
MLIHSVAQPALEQVDLLYYRPLGPFHQYEARLVAAARNYADRIRVTKLRTDELAHLARCGAFVSPTRPTMALVRDGAVVAQAVGDLSARELDLLMRSAC